MVKPDYSVICRTIGKPTLVFLLITFSNSIVAENTTESETKRLYEYACSQCHGLGMIEKTRDGRSGWENTVDKMMVSGAPLTADEMDRVTDYLFQHYGPGADTAMKTGLLPPDSPLQTDGTVSSENIVLPKGNGSDLVEGYCSMCHDLGRVVSTRRDKDDWQRYTKNMLAQGDITISPQDIELVISYLNKHFGKNH